MSIFPGGLLKIASIAKIRWNSTLSRLEFSNDGSTFDAIGSGGSVSASSLIQNLAISTSVAANALTVSLKTQAGVDPSGSDSIKIGFRNSTLSNGNYNIRTITSALSLVVSSGSTLGHQSGVDRYIYVYALDNAGTIKLAVSSAQYDDNSLVTTVAEGGAGAADSNSAIYSDAVYSNVPCRLIGIMISNQATAGTWVSNMSSIEINPVKLPVVAAQFKLSADQTIPNVTTTKLLLDTEMISDKHGLVDAANNQIVINKLGKYRVYSKASTVGNTITIPTIQTLVAVNGSFDAECSAFKGTDVNTQNTRVVLITDDIMDLSVGDEIDLRVFQNSGGNVDMSETQITFLGVEYVGK